MRLHFLCYARRRKRLYQPTYLYKKDGDYFKKGQKDPFLYKSFILTKENKKAPIVVFLPYAKRPLQKPRITFFINLLF